MKSKLLGALLMAAFATSAPIAIHADHHGDQEKRKDLKVIECPPECGFKIRSHDHEEMVEIVQKHAKEHHDMELTDEQVKAVMKAVHETKKDKKKDRHKDKDKAKDRDKDKEHREHSPRY